jgi:hypothetical protein
MLPNTTRSPRKPTSLLYATLATLALLVLSSPGYAAIPQPSRAPYGITATTGAAGTISAVSGDVAGLSSQDQPDATCPSGGQCFTDVPTGNPFYAFVNRIYQQDLVTGYPCGGPGEPCDAQHRPYYRPVNNVTRQQMAKFIDNARHLPGIDIEVSGGTVPIIAHNNTGTAISAYSVSGQALTVQSGNQSAIYAQANEAAVIVAYSTGATGASYGVYGTGHTGLYGGGDVGVVGVGAGSGISGTSPSGIGVYGAGTTGMLGQSTSGIGVYGASAVGNGVHGTSNSGVGVDGISSSGNGVQGTTISGAGVYGDSNNGYGVVGNSNSGAAVYGTSGTGVGVNGISDSHYGVYGVSSSNNGVYGQSTHGNGVFGTSGTGSGAGVYGTGSTWAGYFAGDVHVTGTCCSAGAGTYKIDDPTDPANRYLYHSAVESPDMMDIYNGNVTTDDKGQATVTMPPYFQALNRDFRYQLTVIAQPGQFAQAIVTSEITDNRFSIQTDKPNVKVSWQVTGIRQDGYANVHRMPVEVDKPAGEKGKYLYPTELGRPASSGVDSQEAVQSKP